MSKYKGIQHWKSEEEITYIRPASSLIFSQNIGSFEKHVQTLVRRTSSDFKTPRCLVSTPLGVWKLEEVLLVFELSL